MNTVVNYASPGREAYMEGQMRLAGSMTAKAPEDKMLFFIDKYPQGCPRHETAPYAFKWFAMQQALNEGAEMVLWLDASVVLLKSLAPLWERIEENGYILFDNPGCPENFFTSEDCLNKIGCTLEQAATFSQVMGGIVGVHRNSDMGLRLMASMLNYSLDGVSFAGGSGLSSDPKYIGHRHDQSCLSFLANKHQLQREPYKWVAYTTSVTPDTILELRGM